MIKKFRCLLTIVVMVFFLSLSNFAGVVAFADDEETYLEIPTKGGSLSSGTYKLTEDVTVGGTLKISSGVEVTIDLNGYTITCKDKYAVNIAGGTLNLYDSSTDGDGTIIDPVYSSSYCAVRVSSSGVFNMYGGNLYGEYGLYISTGTANITSGTIKAEDKCGIYSETGTVTISGTDKVEVTALATSNSDAYGICCKTSSYLYVYNPNLYVKTYNSSLTAVYKTSSKLYIMGGHYSTTVASYVADGYICKETDDSEYPYVVTADVELPSLYGETLTLDGSVGVTFYFDMTGQTDPDTYTLVAEIDGADETQTVYSGRSKTIDDSVYYRYTVYVKPTQFNSTISAYLTDGTNSTDIYEYSVATYCLKAISGGWDESDLCKAILNYGDYATAYYSQISINSLENVDDWSDPVAEEWTADLSEYSGTETEGVAKALLLGDSVVIRVYMTSGVACEDDTFSVDGTSLTLHELENESYAYYVEFKVSARNMSEIFTVMKNGEEFTSYSVLSYVNNVVKADTSDSALSDLCKAIYYYSVAADNYAGWQ